MESEKPSAQLPDLRWLHQSAGETG